MAGTIMPNPKFLGFDNNGDPLSGGKLYTYAAGTTTPQDTYSDVGLSVANTNPVILDSGGRATVFLSNSSYKFVLKNSDDVTIWTQDNISAFNPTNLDIEGTVGEAVTAGQLVYLSDGSGGKTAGKWYLTDADFDYASSLPTIAVVTVSAAINASASLRMQGSYTYSSALVAGASYYVSGTAGALATTPGTYNRFVGICQVDGFTLVFSPNPPNVALSITFGTVTATQAFVLGSATTNGIRMDLNSGTMEIREGDGSAYGPLNVGTTQVSGDLKPLANDGGSLGVSGTAWSDAYLASGGVIDWNAGDTTITQSAGKLTLSGSGAGALDVKGAILPTANDGAALGASGTAWADLFLASGGAANWDAGDITVTHASGKLTLAGSGAGTLEVKGAILPTVSNTPALGSTSLMWADLFLGDGAVINFNNGDVTVTHSTNTLAFAGASTGYTFADGPITNDLGAVGTPSYTFTGDLDTGIWSSAADTLNVSTGGSERLRITSTGIIGINNTSPGNLIDANGDSTTGAAFRSTRYSTDAFGTALNMRKSRGTASSPTAVASSDSICNINFHAYGGTNFRNLIQISGVVTNYTSDSNMTTHLSFGTTNAGAGAAQTMILTGPGHLGLGSTPGAYNGSGGKVLEIGSTGNCLIGNSAAITYGQNANLDTNWLYGVTAAASYYQQNGGAHIWVTAPSGTAGNTITFTERMRVSSGGVQCANAISVGGATPAGTGAGITFPAAQSASSDANTLDDYEEGTWTPAVGGTWTANPTNMSGTYTKIGRVVYIRLLFQGGTKAGATNGYFTGLPFTTTTTGTGAVVDSNITNRGLCFFSNTDRVWVTDNTFGAGDNIATGFYFV